LVMDSIVLIADFDYASLTVSEAHLFGCLPSECPVFTRCSHLLFRMSLFLLPFAQIGLQLWYWRQLLLSSCYPTRADIPVPSSVRFRNSHLLRYRTNGTGSHPR
jgi:hypothetical protein